MTLSVTAVVMPLLAICMSDEGLRAIRINSDWSDVVRQGAFWGMLALAFVQLVVHLIHLCREPRVSLMAKNLKASEDKAAFLIENANSLCAGYLQDLGRLIGFGDAQPNTERITLYVHDSESGFQQVGRFSFNQSYVKPGRRRYPDTQGCIGKAWENGWATENHPQFEDDGDAWVKSCAVSGVPKTTAVKLNMKSCCYVACTVRISSNDPPNGILVIESTAPNRLEEAGLRKILTEHRRGYIAFMIKSLEFGDPGTARKEGF